MLLTLTARSLAARLNARGNSVLPMGDLPKYVFQQTGLRGLVLDTSLLKGWGLDALDTLRTQADQAGCPCLLLRETTPIASGLPAGAAFDKTMKRVELVARAANRLGCNALALRPESRSKTADGRELDLHTGFFRALLDAVDRLELNVLIEPPTGWLGEPRSLVDLVKKVGGFRIGTMPTFQAACRTPDCALTLRQTAPYAGAVLGSFDDYDIELPAFEPPPEEEPPPVKKKKKTTRKTASKDKPADQPAPPRSYLPECIGALQAVGFEQILALDYLGSGDAIGAINAARLFIEAMQETV